MIRTNLSRILATRTSLAARRAERRWQKYLDTAAAAGRAHAREQIDIQSPNEWDRVFALADPWAYESDYEVEKYARTLALMPEGTVADALEIACAEGHFTVRLAPHVGRLTAVDISGRALARARERCASHGNITFQTLDLNGAEIPGPFDLIVWSEVLYYVRDLAGVVHRILSQVRPGGFFLTAHARLLVRRPQRASALTGTLLSVWKPSPSHRRPARRCPASGNCARPFTVSFFTNALLLVNNLAQPEIVETDRVGRMTPAAEAPARWPGRPPHQARDRTRMLRSDPDVPSSRG